MSAVPYPTGSAIRYNISSGFRCGIHDETGGIRGKYKSVFGTHIF